MSKPIQKDHELICPGCGVVLDTIFEQPIQKTTNIGASSLSVSLLGNTLEGNIKFHTKRDYYQQTYEKALFRLASICNTFGIPEVFALETMKRIKLKEKGLFSFKEQVRQLLKILEKDDNYLFWKKALLIKKEYENVTGI